MRPLPRLLAFTDERVAGFDDLGVRAAAIAAAGTAVALVARLPHGSADRLAALAQRYVALAAPPMAAVLVTGRADVALAVGAQGVILREDDLAVNTVRQLCHPAATLAAGPAWNAPPAHGAEGPRSRRVAPVDPLVLRSVHSLAEAATAVQDGADAVIVGSIWPSATHPDRAAAGTTLLAQVVALGRPTYAIGGGTAVRAAEARAAGAWGVAAISAVWDADQPYQATMAILHAWSTACS